MPRGFTLVEMMVAVAVFGVLGLISFQLIRYSTEHSKDILDRGERLIELQRAMDVMQRDLKQIVLRRIRDEEGIASPYYQLGGDEFAFEFTRAGWQNFRQERRSDLQRVGYSFFNGSIVRTYWPVLDRAQNTVPQTQQLLEGVQEFEITGINVQGEEVSDWSGSLGVTESQTQDLLIGIKISIAVHPFGSIERLWSLPVTRLPNLKEEAASSGGEESS